MTKFEHPAKKMFGKLADLKVEHDRTNHGNMAWEHDESPDAPHSILHRMLSDRTSIDFEHVIFESMPIIREYMKHRVESVPAKYAWQWAKASTWRRDDEPEGFNTNGHPFEVDGFDIEITIEPDDSPDYSFYGEFVDSWQTGAVENPEAWTSHGNRNHHYIAYFVPAYSEVDRYNDLHKAGMDKQSAHLEARRLVMADLEGAKEYAPVVAVVKAFKNEVELGYDCMGGLDYDDPSDAIFDHDMIGNAIVHAKATLAKLIESAK